jgi:Mg/Co/Ni transporter MgtE
VVRSSITTADIHYFYVVDDDRRLVGIVPARHLLAALPDQRVAEVMISDVVGHSELGHGARSPASTSPRGSCWRSR